MGAKIQILNMMCLKLPLNILVLQEDLVHTIGESAFQGAAGVILWGSTNFSKSRVSVAKKSELVRGPCEAR